MVELVDTRDLKSLGHYGRAGSSPALRTIEKRDLSVSFFYGHGLEPWSKTASGCLSFKSLTDESALALRGVFYF